MKHLALIVLAACSKSNDVNLLLGPSEGKVSRGFLCKSSATNEFLMADVFTAGELHFNLVIDVLDLGDRFPGCRGEELLELCEDPSDCMHGDIRRQCIGPVIVPFKTPFDVRTDIPALASSFKAAVHDKLNLGDLPNNPVIVRVVATTEPCAQIGGFLDEKQALGCAYSCPVQLDQVDGSISVSLDALDEFCEGQVRACAAFPRRPRP